MHTKTLLFSLLFVASPIMADSFYTPEASSNSHHEATIGGVGLVAGGLIGGPFGAIIGGSIGVLTGHQQSKTETITEQQHFITELERELDVISTNLTQSKSQVNQLQSSQQKLQKHNDNLHKQQTQDIKQFVNSYQFDIYFLTNSTSITLHSEQGLFKLADLLKKNPRFHADIEAHSDWRGSNDVNYTLAQNRLNAITNSLTLTGVNNGQLLTTNYGEQANNNNGSSGEEIFYDRRVTIQLRYF